MSSMQTSLCGSCGATCIWGLTTKGQKVLCDAVPSESGHIRLEPHPDNGVPLAIILTKAPPPGTVVYDNHFITCPKRAVWRKPKRKR